MENARNCLNCSNIFRGRSDKKFCSDQCRYAYHQRVSAKNNRYGVSRVNNILQLNHHLLKVFAGNAKKNGVNRDSLAAAGFSFDFFTHYVKDSKGMEWRGCYEVIYRMAGNNKVVIRLEKDGGN